MCFGATEALSFESSGPLEIAVRVQVGPPKDFSTPYVATLLKCQVCGKQFARALSSVPDNIAAEFVEAHTCLNVGAFHASILMCRRTIEAAILEKGGSGKRRHLFERIDHLFEAGKLLGAVSLWCDRIRMVGNMGAHAAVPHREDFDQDYALRVWSLTALVIQAEFIEPPHQLLDPHGTWHSWWGPTCTHGYKPDLTP